MDERLTRLWAGTEAESIGYGVLDVADNSAFVNVGTDHDTPVFATTSIAAWWKRMGKERYPDARELFITADAGGSNAARSRVWKVELQRFADEAGLTINVSHFPPGTSKWNKVEHRLFSFITMNWRGRPLRTYETVINLISNTTNRAGLVVRAAIDRRRYPIGRKATEKQMQELNIERHAFRGCGSHADQAAARTDFRSGCRVSSMAAAQRALSARARS